MEIPNTWSDLVIGYAAFWACVIVYLVWSVVERKRVCGK